MIKQKEIEYNQNFIWDPVGRICFARGRVFRVISPNYENKVRSFLCSELFNELRKRNWIVDTWITEDIEIPGYHLVLEHEKVECTPTELWSFSQWKDAALFYIKIHEFCINHGGTINDARPGNVAFKNGHPIFIDFGSLIKLDDIIIHWERDFYISFWQTLYYLSKGEYFYADAWANNAYCYYIDSQIHPSRLLEDSLYFTQSYPKVVKHYEVFVRQKYYHFKIWSYWTIRMLQLINKIARCLFCKESYWNLFKVQSVYKKPSSIMFQRIKLPYAKTDVEILLSKLASHSKFTKDFTSITKSSNINSVLLYGNIPYGDIYDLRQNFDGKIYVASPNHIYVDNLYVETGKLGLDIQVLCLNIRLEIREAVLDSIHADMLFIPYNTSELFASSLILFNSANKVANQFVIQNDNEDRKDCMDKYGYIEKKIGGYTKYTKLT